jgi:hypothetical protein
MGFELKCSIPFKAMSTVHVSASFVMLGKDSRSASTPTDGKRIGLDIRRSNPGHFQRIPKFCAIRSGCVSIEP